jgi:hypothetical protein
MALKILKFLAIYIFLAAMSLLVGLWPGMLQIHASGNASYISGSHCIISTEVTPIQFTELTNWCTAIHDKTK